MSVITARRDDGTETHALMFLAVDSEEDKDLARQMSETTPYTEVTVTPVSGLRPRHMTMLQRAVIKAERVDSAIRRAKNMRGEVKRMTVAIARRNQLLQAKQQRVDELRQALTIALSNNVKLEIATQRIACLDKELARAKAMLSGIPDENPSESKPCSLAGGQVPAAIGITAGNPVGVTHTCFCAQEQTGACHEG